MALLDNIQLSDELTTEICEWLVSGQPLAEYCSMEGKPSLGQVSKWRFDNDIFAKRFAQARDIGFDSMAERLRTTVRGGTGSSQDWKRDRLIAETELKLLAAWAPKRYGARIEAEQSLGNMDVSELGARVTMLLDKALQALAGAPPSNATHMESPMPAKPTAKLPAEADFLTDHQREVLARTPPVRGGGKAVVRGRVKGIKAAAQAALDEPKTPPAEDAEDRW